MMTDEEICGAFQSLWGDSDCLNVAAPTNSGIAAAQDCNCQRPHKLNYGSNDLPVKD